MRSRHGAGFTLIELMVVVVVVGVILTVAAPAFFEFMLKQRLKGIHAQIATDLQFARAEAASRNTLMRFALSTDSATSCYVIFTAPADNSVRCDCLLGVGSACPNPLAAEVRTAQVPAAQQVRLSVPAGQAAGFAFDPVTGGIVSIPQDLASSPMNRFRIDSSVDTPRTLRAEVNRAGRVTVCRPSGSTMPEPSC